MLTIASYAVAGYFTALRLAGAKARASLMRAVSEHLKVSVGELSTEPGAVVHAASGHRMSFGDIARKIDRLPDPPDLKEQDLKPASQFRLIGRDVLRRDLAAKVDGSAQYAINVDLPGLVQAAVFHAPVPALWFRAFAFPVGFRMASPRERSAPTPLLSSDDRWRIS